MLFILELINFTPYGDISAWLPIALCGALLKISHYASTKIKPTISTCEEVTPRQQGGQCNYPQQEPAESTFWRGPDWARCAGRVSVVDYSGAGKLVEAPAHW